MQHSRSDAGAAVVFLVLLSATAAGPVRAAEIPEEQGTQMNAIAGEARIFIAPPPRRLDAAMAPIDPRISARSGERARLVEKKVLVAGPEKFSANLIQVDQGLLRFANDFALGLRLPEGNRIALRVGDRVTLDYKPATGQGMLETELTLSDIKADGGALIMQIVRRGGFQPVTIETPLFRVVQTGDETDAGKGTAGRVMRVAPVVEIVGGKQSVPLLPGRTVRFQADGHDYDITLVLSLHFERPEKEGAAEGPPYYLEYAVTRGGQ